LDCKPGKVELPERTLWADSGILWDRLFDEIAATGRAKLPERLQQHRFQFQKRRQKLISFDK